MGFATLSDGLLHSVEWFSGGAVALMVLLLLQILQLRLGLIARERHERQFIRLWQPLLAGAIAGENGALPPLRGDDLMLFLKMWNHLHASVRGNAAKQLNLLALRIGVLQHISPLLHHKNRGFRLLALTTLGNLGARDDWETILECTRTPDPLLSWTAAHTLFQIDAHAALRDLEQQLVDRMDWPVAHLIVLLKESGTDELHASLANSAVRLAGSADPEDMARLHRLLQVLHAAPYPLVIPAIHDILASTWDDETLAQCLKFLREPEDLVHVRAHANHPDWVVRLQVAQAFGRFGAAEDMPRLIQLMGDPVWWVRYRATQALVALARGNAQVLATWRAQLKDRFALDMLAMVAAEKAHP